MKNWTIKKRITLGFAVIVALSTIMGVLAWNSMRQINDHADGIVRGRHPGLSMSTDIMQNLANAHLALIRHCLSTNTADKRTYQDLMSTVAATNAVLIARLEKVCNLPAEKEFFQKMSEARLAYLTVREPILKLSNAGRNDEAIALMSSAGRVAYDAYDKLSMDFSDFETDIATKAADSIRQSSKSSKLMLSLIVSGELIVSILLGVVVIVGLNRTLRHVSSSIGEGAEQVTSAAAQVSTSSQSLAEGASQQASSLEETSSSLEELSSMTKRNAENTQKADGLAKQARHAADKGANDMRTMISAMEAIKVSSDDIAKIIKTIDEIAFQTNILALNAAVEAARAGEAGMGFAVVADEVRSLAQRSAQAAKETASKIEGAIAKTGQGVQISSQVAETLNDIVVKVRQVDELVAEVASASREQTQGITQINTAVSQMEKVTQSNAASAEESAAASEELNAQAESMKQAVGELLQLVSGAGEHLAPASRPRPTRAPEFQRAPSSTAAPPATNGHRHTNGHAVAAAPLTLEGNGRVEIPMTGDFKDF